MVKVIKTLKERWLAESPIIYKWITNLAGTVTAITGALIIYMQTYPNTFPDKTTNMVIYIGAVALAVTTLMSKLTVKKN